MDPSLRRSLHAIQLLMALESIIGTVVGPSLMFYIQSVGGTKDDYGKASSIHSIGVTLMMFVFGKWVDRNGNKYQEPFAFTFIFGILGSLVYFLASMLPKGFWGVHAIFLGRFIQGMGVAGKTLCKSWIGEFQMRI